MSGEKLKNLFGKTRRKRKTNFAKDTDGTCKRIVKICPVKMYGQPTNCLLDKGAVSNLISSTSVDDMGLTIAPTKRTIAVVDGKMS